MTKTRPGEIVTVSCPEGSLPQVVVSDKVPSDKPVAVVLRVQGKDIALGPLQGGQMTFAVPCTNGQTATAEYSLTPLKKEEMPEKSPPLVPFDAAYPLWFWIVLGLVFFTTVGLILFSIQRLQKKLTPPKPVKVAPPATPAQKFEGFFREARKAKWASAQDEASVSLLYGQGYDRMRKFIEAHYRMKTVIETTREFLGTLRALAPQEGLSSQIFDKIEFCLIQADSVRFAKENPPVANREQFLKMLEEIYEALRVRSQATPKETQI